MKNKNMSKKTEQFFLERNSSKSTISAYKSSIKHFEKSTGMTIDDMIEIAKQEKTLLWEDTQLRKWLITFRNQCYNNFKERAAKINLSRIQTIFRHFNIPIQTLPYFSTKQTIKSEEIDYEDLPDREILKKCIEIKNPLLKATTLFISSTGISRTDTLKLTVGDYLEATFEYHKVNEIYKAIDIMDESNLDIVPSFKLNRKKTGETYRTFASPESVRAVNLYLLSRKEELTNDSKLFKINLRYFNDMFKETNDLLNLGQINGRGRFCPQMLRSYHATQLAEAGMNDSHIDIIQGRKPQSIARKSYIRIKRSKLKEEYIKCLPYLVVEDINKVKTELDRVTEKKNLLETEYTELKRELSEINSIKERLLRLEQRD